MTARESWVRCSRAMPTSSCPKELFEERAAIKQFDGKMTREEAERSAAEEQLHNLRKRAEHD